MAIKKTSINIHDYHRLMVIAYTKKLNEANALKRTIKDDIQKLYKEIKDNLDTYKDKFNVNLLDYDEFVLNTYTNGKFFKMAKGLYLNKVNNYELVSDLYDLRQLADLQKRLVELDKKIAFYSKLASMKYREYEKILSIYFTEVHKKMILEGAGYAFGSNIGWICANRVVFKNVAPHIDYIATRRREAELKAKGERIWNKEEAEWCKRNGIEYKAADKRVFQSVEYGYEFPLIDCKLENGRKYKLCVTNYIHKQLRGKTYEELIELCGRDTNKICELPVDLNIKLKLCDKADKLLYAKFIRNENQESLSYAKANRKNR